MLWHRILIATCVAHAVCTTAAAQADGATDDVARGRYLVGVAGCNDCHTAGYPESGGTVPETRRLTGNAVGFRGPWGTTFPTNLRLSVQELPEAAWMARARSRLRPPMPWFSLRDMSDADLRAVYRYIRSLGPAGAPAPAYAAPGKAVEHAYIDFVPRNVTGPVALSEGQRR